MSRFPPRLPIEIVERGVGGAVCGQQNLVLPNRGRLEAAYDVDRALSMQAIRKRSTDCVLKMLAGAWQTLSRPDRLLPAASPVAIGLNPFPPDWRR